MEDFESKPYHKTSVGYSIFAGLEYYNKKYYNFSTNIGFIRKGGKGQAIFTDHNGDPMGETSIGIGLHYISINTTIDFKYPIRNGIIPFITIGPRFDYLLFYRNEFLDSYEKYGILEKQNLGFNGGCGLKFDFNKIRLGMRTDYYFNFKKIIDNTEMGVIEDRTFTLNFSIGFKLN